MRAGTVEERNLGRLGLKEIEERLEAAPLVAGGGIQGTEASSCIECCTSIEIKLIPEEVVPVGDDWPRGL